MYHSLGRKSRKPGRTIGFPFLSVFKRLVPRDRDLVLSYSSKSKIVLSIVSKLKGVRKTGESTRETRILAVREPVL